MALEKKSFTILGKSFNLKRDDTLPCLLANETFDTQPGQPPITLCQNDFIEANCSPHGRVTYHVIPPSQEVLEKYDISVELFNEIAEEMRRVIYPPCHYCGHCSIDAI